MFRLAHEKQPTARTLRGIGMASFEMRDYVEATRALAASLRDQRRPLTAEQRKHAQALLARAETFVGQFSLKLSPANLSVFVDGRPAMLEADGSVLLPLGPSRDTSARCTTCSPNEKQLTVDVAGGEKKQLELTLALASAPPATADTTGSAGGGGSVPTLVGGEADPPPRRTAPRICGSRALPASPRSPAGAGALVVAQEPAGGRRVPRDGDRGCAPTSRT